MCYPVHDNRGVAFILQAVLFRVVPTALEISLVCGILVRKCTPFDLRKLAMFIDLQVRLGLCGDHSHDYGRIYVVYCPYDGVAVRQLRSLLIY